ncbi:MULTISPECIES: hypothetical protein [Mesorhizobium]|uniref:hypothetical protein n=1 Tax=Mesorhizobium TaxID=68287 RepID=UPI0012EA3DC9|nr:MULTISPECIES: hypothetical protein [Mesorhizobium]MCV3211377.1 hypothetical protein [Mesorhizobium sp. YC-2]MCV3233102.1 hypothetical protein [Mesorhizobium sp. YC-39]
MKTDMSAYGVNELAPEEASAISGGLFWQIVWSASALLAFAAATIAEGAVRGRNRG